MRMRSTLVALCLSALAITAQPVRGADQVDLRFMDVLIQLQPQVATVLRRAHEAKLDRSRLREFDDQYDDVVAAVNGFLKSVAYGVENNTLHVTEWNSRADEIIADVKALNNTIRAAETDRRQATDAASKGAPGVTIGSRGVTFEIPLVDITKLLESRQQMRFDGLKVGDAARAKQANSIRSNLWPERCAIGLDGHPCVAATSSP